MDEVLELLERTTKRTQKVFDDSKEMASKNMAVYDQILRSKEATEEQKIKAFIGRLMSYDRLDRVSSQLSLLYTLQIFAFKVKVLEVTVDKINEQIEQSGVLQKGKEIENIRKHIDALKILVEAQYESHKEIKAKSRELPYIF